MKNLRKISFIGNECESNKKVGSTTNYIEVSSSTKRPKKILVKYLKQDKLDIIIRDYVINGDYREHYNIVEYLRRVIEKDPNFFKWLFDTDSVQEEMMNEWKILKEETERNWFRDNMKYHKPDISVPTPFTERIKTKTV